MRMRSLKSDEVVKEVSIESRGSSGPPSDCSFLASLMSSCSFPCYNSGSQFHHIADLITRTEYVGMCKYGE